MKSHQHQAAVIKTKQNRKPKKTVLKGWMQHARIAVHCQGTTEKSTVQRREGHDFLKNHSCFYETLFIVHPNYMNYFKFMILAIRQHI